MRSVNQRGQLGPIDPRLAAGGAPTTSALSQPAWFINAITGSDSANGATSATALATFGEYSRRIGTGTVTVTSTLNIETDLTEPTFNFYGQYLLGLFWNGPTTNVLRAGTLTAATPWVLATSTEGTISDAALPGASWADSGPGGSSLVDQQIVLTSGPNVGAKGWIAKDNGTKVARFSPLFRFATFQNEDPALGNSYEVRGLITLDGAVNFAHTGIIVPTDMRFVGSAATFIGWDIYSGNVFSDGCNMDTPAIGTVRLFGGAPCTHVSMRIAPFTWDLWFGNICAFAGVLIKRSIRSTGAGGLIQIFGDSLVQDGPGLDTQLGGGQILIQANQFLAYYDQSSASRSAIRVRNGGNAGIRGKVFGANNLGFGARADAGSSILYPDGDNFTAHFDVLGGGLTSEVRVGATNTTYAAVGVVGTVIAANNAMVVPNEF